MKFYLVFSNEVSADTGVVVSNIFYHFTILIITTLIRVIMCLNVNILNIILIALFTPCIVCEV